MVMKREIKQRMGSDPIGVEVSTLYVHQENAIFEQRPEGLEGATILGKGNRRCKDSEMLETGR